ncbi:hypothetical protein COCVIDRAFT_94422 [Bipolaris victoriae FI3]|uniref:Uncharacterized protein n=1 Tax=Bipolaris victoriae (strain FI3) TaxID=930091 RepID=W7EP73_BIPV3|nr:hypothetical protein COCVIDRAFT_94422 [Bipolaris victoriae FI3]
MSKPIPSTCLPQKTVPALSQRQKHIHTLHTYIHIHPSALPYPPRQCTTPLLAPRPSPPPQDQPRLLTPLPPRRRRSISYTVVVGHTFNDGANHQPPHSPHSRYRQSGPLSTRCLVPFHPSIPTSLPPLHYPNIFAVLGIAQYPK